LNHECTPTAVPVHMSQPKSGIQHARAMRVEGRQVSNKDSGALRPRGFESHPSRFVLVLKTLVLRAVRNVLVDSALLADFRFRFQSQRQRA
jgi:hypothetical protein